MMNRGDRLHHVIGVSKKKPCNATSSITQATFLPFSDRTRHTRHDPPWLQKPRLQMRYRHHHYPGCTRMLEDVGKETALSIETSRQDMSQVDMQSSFAVSKANHQVNVSATFVVSYLMISANISSARPSVKVSSEEVDCLRFSSSFVKVSLFLSKSKNSSGMASAVGSSSGSW